MPEHIIISLGSNIGDRKDFLYKALALLEGYPISIMELSKVYETSSWGFESTPFYNACAIISTSLKPKALLKALLNVERKLGRERNLEKGYQDRTIDLDLLFYNSEIIHSEELKIPHPKLHLRSFILTPLLDIAPELYHPILHKNLNELHKQVVNSLKITKLNFDLNLPPIFKEYPFISIEGNIGIGKTTLAKMISEHYFIDLYTEVFTENPYLEAFYKNPDKFALSTETYFLKDRFEKDLIFWKKNRDCVVADFCIYKCLVFAKKNLSSQDYNNYRKDFHSKLDGIKKPSLLLLLNKNTGELKKQIKKRGRYFEQEIKQNYLDKLENGYRGLIKDISFPVLEYSLDNIEFENNQFEFEKILRAIFRFSFL